MTDNNHPITPPPELVQKLADGPGTWLEKISKAYCAGADQRLEAVKHWLITGPYGASIVTGSPTFVADLCDSFKPKPPSLKERGREALRSIHNAVVMETGGRELDVLKEIVESLPD